MSEAKGLVINCETGEVTEVDLTPEEITERQTMRQQAEQREIQLAADNAAKAVAKASAEAKLAALGLTPEEIAAL
jgi:hypothetical protein